MRFTYYLSSMLHVFVAFFVMIFGASIITLPFAPNLRLICYQLLQEGSPLLIYIGASFVAFSIVLIACFWAMYRKRFYTLEMKGGEAQIDEALIRSYIEEYWKKSFNIKKNCINVIVHSNQQVEIIASKAPFELDDEKMVSRVQNELGILLARRLGYEKEFLLTVHA
ncbi:MAG: hypothetical protein P0S95_06745 [Rhabdochlamydiaceae bacterium]|nr:hypothetical protein [Candidatus Amphrikana amoebophyrae]